jgi:hypothetical protein
MTTIEEFINDFEETTTLRKQHKHELSELTSYFLDKYSRKVRGDPQDITALIAIRVFDSQLRR